ncbi:transcription factor bHLH96 [Oryza brachyantha]|uniref:BHLH domain-containing protein n=1 Tax=Oryza brachyantha TaxID=4533 RepID=J3LKT3_ORYBR|nr:transcription factor bHLH96 [Oryza brachyantha]
MALEAVVFPQGHFGYGCGRDSPAYGMPWCDVLGGGGGGGFGEFCGVDEWDDQLRVASVDEWDVVSKDHSDASTEGKAPAPAPERAAPVAAGRRKRRRTKVIKNKEEIECQRMTHIAVERNRRRQMNEYLAVLRSLMPPSYAQRGDQASIVGGAINYVKELEQLLQSLEVQKSLKNRTAGMDAGEDSPFSGFFSFPQYCTSSRSGCSSASAGSSGNASSVVMDDTAGSAERVRPAAIADIEVTMVEGHASLKVLARRRPKQLLKLVVGLQQLRIPPLHLNVTTVDAMVLYSFSLKVEDDSKLGSVEDIATAVHEILGSIQQQEAVLPIS